MDSVLKWHGGKAHLAEKIIRLMPPHLHYVEPYAGSLAVLLAKNPEECSEVVNDRNLQLTNFWRVLQNKATFEEFARMCAFTPFSQIEWYDSRIQDSDDPIRNAHRLFVKCRQSMAGRMTHWSPLSKNRLRGGMNEQISAWLNAVEGLTPVHQRLLRVVIYGEDALSVIRREDSVNTLFYCDPPYLQSTRATPNVYTHEMWVCDHIEMLDVLTKCVGKVMLSGYDSDLYQSKLKEWTVHTFDIPNSSASGNSKRIMSEKLWCNW